MSDTPRTDALLAECQELFLSGRPPEGSTFDKMLYLCRTLESERAPDCPAAFINAIAEEGTKDEAIKYLQETWNEYREADAAAKRWYSAAAPYATPEALKEALSARTEAREYPQPLLHPLGDGHHTEVPFTEEDKAIADKLAYGMGTLFSDVDDEHSRYWYYERTSINEWSRVVRALRIHGLRIVQAPESPQQQKPDPCACPDKAQCDEAGECLKAMGVFK